jgi:septum formation protein
VTAGSVRPDPGREGRHVEGPARPTPRIILASGSARRPELLAGLGVRFDVAPANVDESSDERVLTRDLALRKARAGATSAPDAIVIGADTLVVLGGQLLGKPADPAEARATLEALRGRTHQVVSGVAVVAPAGAPRSVHLEPVERRGTPASAEGAAVVTTHVTMRPYTDEEIAAYIASGDPFDKSGAYAVQHPTFAPAARVDGCLCSVIGLPLWTLRTLLSEVAHLDTATPSFERCATCPCHEDLER